MDSTKPSSNATDLFNYLKLVTPDDQACQQAATMQVNAGTKRIQDLGDLMEVDDVKKAKDNTEQSDKDSNERHFIDILCSQYIEDPAKTIVQHQVKGNEAKMLVILDKNGEEQRLITFEVPKDDCTVADLLEQANIQASQEPRVSLVTDPTLHINYFVELTAKTGSTGSTTKVAKYIKGMLAVCPFCGMSAADFNYCMRCKRKLPDDVKSIPITTGIMTKRDNSSDNPSLVKKQNSRLLQRVEMISKRGRRQCRTVIPPSTNLLLKLKCHTVRIGSYRVVLDCAVTITSDNLLIKVPSLKNESKTISLKIKYGEIMALLIHFSKSTPVLFFYTNFQTGYRIRNALGMQNPTGQYFDPCSRDQTHKRITLLPERISDEAKLALKEIFGPIMSELNRKEANDILLQAVL